MGKRLKIAVIGLRGFPDVQGGVETHCEQIYPRLVELGCEVVVFGRAPYLGDGERMYKGVKVVPLSCPKKKSLETLVNTFLGCVAAKKQGCDVLHIHAIGPGFFTLFARILGMRVVFTTHGSDYKRAKWGKFAKCFLRMGEYLACRFANEVITISPVIAEELKSAYGRESKLIPNGIDIPKLLEAGKTLEQFDLKREKYILSVGRFVPEKAFFDLIKAFIAAKISGHKLVVVGDADHDDAYSRLLKEMAKANSGIVLTGKLKGKALAEIYSNAAFFVIPSYHEGLPIVLLEAMSYERLCLASDIAPNKCVELDKDQYFSVGDVGQLSEKLREFVGRVLSEEQKKGQIEKLRREYDWDEIARRTLRVYEMVVKEVMGGGLR